MIKKLVFILVLCATAGTASAQFPTKDSLVKFINKWIRNSAVDAFTNLRLNTALIGMVNQADSAGITKVEVSGTTLRIITTGKDTFAVTLPNGGSGNTNSNIGSGFRIAIPGTNNLKTLFAGLCLVVDSSTNSNALTYKTDTACIATYFLRRKDSTAYVTLARLRDSMLIARSRLGIEDATGVQDRYINMQKKDLVFDSTGTMEWRFQDADYLSNINATKNFFQHLIFNSTTGSSSEITNDDSTIFMRAQGKTVNQTITDVAISPGIVKVDSRTSAVDTTTKLLIHTPTITSPNYILASDADTTKRVSIADLTRPFNYIDVYGFFGQSNMKGFNTDGVTDTVQVMPGTAYQFYQGIIKIANDPIGNAQGSSMGPAFARQYYNLTSRKICLVPAAFEGTSQTIAADDGHGNWDTTGTLFAISVARLDSAITALRSAGYTPILKGILWGQGETDAIGINASLTTQAAYDAACRKMIRRYKDIYGKQISFLIFRTATETVGGVFNSAKDIGYSQIRAAQEAIAMGDSLTRIVFYNAFDFPGRSLFSDQYHYKQKGYNEMGYIGAMNVVSGNLGAQFQAGNRYIPTGNFGIGTGVPTFKLQVVAASSTSNAANFVGRSGFNRTTPLYGVDVGDSARIRTITFVPKGFGGAPAILTTTFLTFENTNNILINQGSIAGGIPEFRLALNNVNINELYSGVYSFFNFQAQAGTRQNGVFTTSGFGASAGGAKIGGMLFVPGTNFANDRLLAQYGDDSLEIRIRTAGIGEVYLNGKTTISGRVKLSTISDGAAPDSVLVWKQSDSTIRKISQASISSAAPLTTNYIGVGSSNLLSGSSAYTYDGTIVKQENSGAIDAITSTTSLGSTSGASSEQYVKDIPTAADQRLGGFMFGSRNGTTASNITAGLQAYSNGTWTDNVSEQTYVTMSTSATNARLEVMRWTANGRVSIGGTTNPTASLHLKAGAAAAGNAPLKYPSGTNLTTAEAGAEEYNGTSRFFTPGSTRLRYVLTDNTIPAVGQFAVGDGVNYTNADIFPIVSVTTTGTTTLAATAKMTTIKADVTSGNVTITITPNHTGQIFNVKRMDGSVNTLTIQMTSGTIDGAATKTLVTQYSALQIQWDGTNAIIL